MDPKEWTQAVWHGSKYCYPLSFFKPSRLLLIIAIFASEEADMVPRKEMVAEWLFIPFFSI